MSFLLFDSERGRLLRRSMAATLVGVLAFCLPVVPVGAAVHGPPVGDNLTLDYQLGGAYPSQADILVRDWRDAPIPGAYNVCYVNGFQTQPEHEEWWISRHPDLLLRKDGVLVEDPAWPGEYLLDIGTRKERQSLMVVLGRWIDQCARSGFQAVEADNVDSWQRSLGLLTRADARKMSRLITKHAHTRGLASAQKNAVELVGERRKIGWDFAIIEGCFEFDECDEFSRAYEHGILAVEYELDTFMDACASIDGNVVMVLRDRELVPPTDPGHVIAHCNAHGSTHSR